MKRQEGQNQRRECDNDNKGKQGAVTIKQRQIKQHDEGSTLMRSLALKREETEPKNAMQAAGKTRIRILFHSVLRKGSSADTLILSTFRTVR